TGPEPIVIVDCPWAYAVEDPATAASAPRNKGPRLPSFLVAAFGRELSFNFAPINGKNDRNCHLPGLPRADQSKPNCLLKFRSRDRALENFMPRAVVLDDSESSLRQIAMHCGIVLNRHRRHRRARLIMRNACADDVDGRRSRWRRDAHKHAEIIEDLN